MPERWRKPEGGPDDDTVEMCPHGMKVTRGEAQNAYTRYCECCRVATLGARRCVACEQAPLPSNGA